MAVRGGELSWRARRHREAILKSKEGSESPSGNPGGVERVWESLQKGWED